MVNIALQSMVICKQPHIGGEGAPFSRCSSLREEPSPDLLTKYPSTTIRECIISYLLVSPRSGHNCNARSFVSQDVSGGCCALFKMPTAHGNARIQYTNPPSALGFWIPLEKCTPENGALSFLPGSHLTAPITKRFVRMPGGGTGFEHLVPPEEAPPNPQGKYILEACMPGALLICQVSDVH